NGSYNQPYYYDLTATANRPEGFNFRRGQTAESSLEQVNGQDVSSYTLQQVDRTVDKKFDPLWAVQLAKKVSGFRLDLEDERVTDGCFLRQSNFCKRIAIEKSQEVPNDHAIQWIDAYITTQQSTFDLVDTNGVSTVKSTVEIGSPNGIASEKSIDFTLNHVEMPGSGTFENNDYSPPYLGWSIDVEVKKDGQTQNAHMDYFNPQLPFNLPQIGSIADHLTFPASLHQIRLDPSSYSGNPYLPVETYEPEWEQSFLIEIWPSA
ncbi:MAG: hypothetical protein ABL921_24030, partial [Pirellula sp.]